MLQIVEEAGGLVSRADGEKYCVFDRSVLASNGVLHDKVSFLPNSPCFSNFKVHHMIGIYLELL